MAGAGLRIDLSGLEGARQRLAALANFDRRELLDTVGALHESQVRRRILDEKTDPEGARWPEWSSRYLHTRHDGHSLLQGEGDLLDSISYAVGSDSVEIGSNLIYGATHQFGDPERGIPARAYLGLSANNEAELEAVLQDWFERLLQ